MNFLQFIPPDNLADYVIKVAFTGGYFVPPAHHTGSV